MQQRLSQWFTSLGKRLGGIEGAQMTLKLFEPAIQAFAYGGIGDC